MKVKTKIKAKDGSAARGTSPSTTRGSTMNYLRSARVRLLALAAVLAWATPPPVRAEVIENDSIDFTGFTVFVPCAAGGAGELVVFTGQLHVLFEVTVNNGGGFHIKEHFQPQGLSGVGLTTGDKYQATGVTQEEINLAAGEEETFINNFRMIGQGPGNNFLIHETFHITINANGDVTTVQDNFSVECK